MKALQYLGFIARYPTLSLVSDYALRLYDLKKCAKCEKQKGFEVLLRFGEVRSGESPRDW